MRRYCLCLCSISAGEEIFKKNDDTYTETGDHSAPMVRRLVVDPSKCVGCRYCELWCSYKHEGVFSPSFSRIIVVKDDRIGLDYPIVCRMCDPAPCIEACPNDALTRGEDGIIRVVDAKCNGCGSCVEACPYGAIRLSPRLRRPLICDLCGGDEPICVKKCPTNALRLYPLAEEDLSENEKAFDKAYRYALEEHKRLMRRWGLHVR